MCCDANDATHLCHIHTCCFGRIKNLNSTLDTYIENKRRRLFALNVCFIRICVRLSERYETAVQPEIL